MTMTAIDWFITAGTFRSAFYEQQRDGDGSKYWSLTDEAETDCRDFVRELHDKEMPNDWRFETIVNIIDAIIEHSKGSNDYWDDQPMAIADSLTNISNWCLLDWYQRDVSRLSYVDEAREEGFISETCTTAQQLAIGQHQAIAQMAVEIIQKLGLLDD